MKKRLTKIVALGMAFTLLFTQTVFAIPGNVDNNVKDIAFDEDALEAEFESLSALEASVLSGEVSTVDEANNLGFELDQYAGIKSVKADLEFDWPAALWGFLCCPVGFFIYVTNKNKSKDEKTSYWIGVAAGTVINLIYVAAVGVPEY